MTDSIAPLKLVGRVKFKGKSRLGMFSGFGEPTPAPYWFLLVCKCRSKSLSNCNYCSMVESPSLNSLVSMLIEEKESKLIAFTASLCYYPS